MLSRAQFISVALVAVICVSACVWLLSAKIHPRGPLVIRHIDKLVFTIQGQRVNLDGLMSYLKKYHGRRRMSTNLNCFIFEFSDGKLPIDDFVRLIRELVRSGYNHIRFSVGGLEYLQPFPVESSLDLSDLVVDLQGKPQPRDYRSFNMIRLDALVPPTEGYCWEDKTYSDYGSLLTAIVSRFGKYVWVELNLSGVKTLSEYCAFLEAARKAGIAFCFFFYGEAPQNRISVPVVLGRSWPFSQATLGQGSNNRHGACYAPNTNSSDSVQLERR